MNTLGPAFWTKKLSRSIALLSAKSSGHRVHQHTLSLGRAYTMRNREVGASPLLHHGEKRSFMPVSFPMSSPGLIYTNTYSFLVNGYVFAPLNPAARAAALKIVDGLTEPLRQIAPNMGAYVNEVGAIREICSMVSY